ncbi:MAG: DegT/DnrJ/EryC1/StrS family aminotransferase [Candidatus Cloacimonadota bacterium]|nr:DegT/DnrJ/EryC1/StrS family aminotransferase [Candidatus Cloacimonadota bacterium]
MKVPMLDLNAQYEPIKKDIFAAFEDVFETKRFIGGPKIEELESKIAEYCQCKYAIGVSSGTDALIISLTALNIGEDDEVITTPFTFFATAGSIHRVGAKPVFVDIDQKTYNINSNLIEEKITDKTKAILAVHLFGQIAEMDKINEIAKKYNLAVIEDAAQAIGSEYKSKRAGSIGNVGCFSFFPSKNLGCLGDGGIVTTNDKTLAEKIGILRNHGSKPKYHHHIIGGNFRLDALQAAFLLQKFPLLENWHRKRQENAEFYNENLKNLLTVPYVEDYNRMIYNQYTLRSKKRDELELKLTEANIGNAIYYPIPLHLQECFEFLGYKKGDFPEAEKAAKQVLSIPIYSELNEKQKNYIVDNIKSVFE